MNVISYTLSGTKFLEHARRRGDEARRHLNHWKARFHVSSDVPLGLRNRLIEQDHQVVMCGENVDRSGVFWRYWPLGDPECRSVFVCDVDKAIDGRLIALMGAWQSSKRRFVVPEISGNNRMVHMAMMARGTDPSRIYRADAGFFGARDAPFPDIKECIERWRHDHPIVDRWDDNRFVTEMLIPSWEDENEILRLTPPREGTRPEDCPPCREATTMNLEYRADLLAANRAHKCCGASRCNKPCKWWVKGVGIAQNYCVHNDSHVHLDETWRDLRWRCPAGVW